MNYELTGTYKGTKLTAHVGRFHSENPYQMALSMFLKTEWIKSLWNVDENGKRKLIKRK